MMNLSEENQKRFYGLALALMNIVTLLFWDAFDFSFGLATKLAVPTENPWPFIPANWPIFVSQVAVPITGAYIFVSFLSVATHLTPATPFRFRNITLAVALTIKLLIYFSSYDFMGNYHYMSNLVSIGYILTAGHLVILQFLICLFYFGAGLIKLNWEWISGSALLKQTFISGPILIAACLYVIVLELVLIWGLFAKNKQIRYATIFQLVLFHIFSWHIVGFYYPCIMLLMISIFLIQPDVSGKELARHKIPLTAISALFLTAQLYPKLLNKDEALTAEGRMWSLNMLDAKSECNASLSIQKEDEILYLDNPVEYAIRVRCDPLVYFNYAKSLCSRLDSNEAKSLRLNIISKKTSDHQYKWIVRDQAICSSELKYSILRNSWIQNGPDIAPVSKIEPLADQNPKTINQWLGNVSRTNQLDINTSWIKSESHLDIPINNWIHLALKSSPAKDGNSWYVAGDAGQLWIFEKSAIKRKIRFPYSNFGIHGSFAFDATSIYFGTYDGLLHSLNKETGHRQWVSKLGNSIGASPLIIGSVIYIPAEFKDGHSKIFAVDSQNGAILWESPFISSLTHSSLAYSSDKRMLYAGSGDGKVYAFDSSNGSISNQTQLDGKIIATPIASDKIYIVSTSGTVAALELNNLKVSWQKKFEIGTRAALAFHAESRQLFVALENGHYLSLAGESGATVWEHTFQRKPWSQPALVKFNQKWALLDECNNKELCWMDTKTGKVLYTYKIKDNLFTALGVSENELLAILHDGRIQILKY